VEHYGYLQVKNRIASENYGMLGISVRIEYSELFTKALELTLNFFLELSVAKLLSTNQLY